MRCDEPGAYPEPRVLAEAFPVSEYVADELAARGIDLDGYDEATVDVIRAALLWEGPAPLPDAIAAGLAAAFGTSAAYWLALDAAYRAVAGPKPNV